MSTLVSGRKVMALLLALLLGGCGPAALDTPSPAATTPAAGSPVPSELRQMELDITEAVNDERRDNGLQPLAQRDDLASVARDYSAQMLEEDFFGHVDPAGRDVADRVRAAGITFMAVGENLYLGEGPIDHVGASVSGWMDSPGHRENILRDVFSDTGVGLAREGNEVRVTQIFLTGP